MTKTNVPLLRFSGFSEEWKEERLKSILLERNLKKEPSKEFPLMAFASQKGIVLKGDRYDRSALVKDDNKKYKITKFNDFIYSSNNFKTGSIGLNKFGDATISPVYSVFNVINNNNSDFFGVLSKNKSFIYKMLKYQQGVTYGQQRIKEDDFLKIIVRVPYKNEQQKIGAFFAKQDKLIELQTQKVDQLKKLKRGYLQKMFPQEGETVPRLRFSGFSGEWKKEKLGCISNISNGVTGDVNLHDGKYKITRIETISDGRVNENKLGYIGYNPGENKLLKKGDILYSNINSISHIGKTAIFESASTIYHGINLTRISVCSEFNSYFINYLLNTPKYKLWSIRHANQAVSQASINNKDLSKMQIIAPTLSEQKVVATFLLSLDKLIEEQSNKLDQLKQQKKAYLQKMFI